MTFLLKKIGVACLNRGGFLLVAFLITIGGAQISSASAFRTLSLGSAIAGVYVNPASPVQVEVASRFITGPYRSNSSNLQFFGLDETTGLPQMLAVAAIPAGVRQPLIVFRNVPQRLEDGTELPYSTFVLNDAARGFPVNSVRFFNTASFPLAVSFSGEAPFVLAPGQSQVVSYGALARNSTKVVQLAAPSPSGEWQRIGAGDIMLRRNNRHLLFLAPRSTDAVDELGPQDLVLILDSQQRIPRALADEGDSE